VATFCQESLICLGFRARYYRSLFRIMSIERKHLTFRTRLKCFVRKTICFSKSMRLHDIVMGFFVNRDEFGMLV
jgi:hypothetical protein